MQKIEDETGLYRLEDGRIRVRTTAKDPTTGKMVERQRTIDGDIAEARRIRTELKAEIQSRSQKPQIITLADYAERWVERKARRWKKSTEKKCVNVLSYHVLPEIGHLSMRDIGRRDITDWIMTVEEKRKDDGTLYSTDSVRGWWRVLRNMIRDAHAQGYLDEDITSRHDAPSTGVTGRQEQRTLSASQIGAVVEATRQYQPQRYAEVVTLAYTGMRVGELYGLHWEDIDLADRIIEVRRSAWKGEAMETKTGASRAVPVPDLVVEALKDHREKMIRDQHPGLEAAIVFPARHGGYRYGTSLSKPLRRVRNHLDIDVRVTPQVLRRTWNTLLVEARVDHITIRSILGHSSDQMTEHYAGVPADKKRAAIDGALGSLLGTGAGGCDTAGGD